MSTVQSATRTLAGVGAIAARGAPESVFNNEAQIVTLLTQLDPGVAKLLREARSQLRALFPRGYELVYSASNAGAMVFAISTTPRSAQTVLSIAGHGQRVTLAFSQGHSLEDPKGLLHGEPGTHKRMALASGSDLARPAVRALIDQAVAPLTWTLRQAPPLTTVLKFSK